MFLMHYTLALQKLVMRTGGIFRIFNPSVDHIYTFYPKILKK